MTTLPRPRSHPPSASSPIPAKAALDRIVATLFLLLTGLWLAVIALALWLTDDGPVLVREIRVGRHGRPFSLLRFRTSRCGGSAGEQPAAASGATCPVGRMLRRYHLDALPQLINVVKGDLSLVGPRPRRTTDPRAFLHTAVRPGLIDPWDARTPPRSDAAETRAVQMYLQQWSPRRDMTLAWQAVRRAALSR